MKVKFMESKVHGYSVPQEKEFDVKTRGNNVADIEVALGRLLENEYKEEANYEYIDLVVFEKANLKYKYIGKA